MKCRAFAHGVPAAQPTDPSYVRITRARDPDESRYLR